jgi:methyl-accepting chemotaxis protein
MATDRYIKKTALAVTRWIGSPVSVLVHTVIFVAAFLAVAQDLIVFEEMLLILTTIVSLEAIYLSIFIQMSLNYTTQELEEVSEDIEEMQEDIGELQEDVEEISEDVEDISEEDAAEEAEDEKREQEQRKTLTDIQSDLRRLMEDIGKLQKNSHHTPPSA